MTSEIRDDSLKALQDIRLMMDRSTRFLSLSGASGVWAGCVAVAGTLVARSWLNDVSVDYTYSGLSQSTDTDAPVLKFVLLALTVLVLALAGGYYFTWKKTKNRGEKVWNAVSKRMAISIAIPLLAGGIFALIFLRDGHVAYIAPACLAFYGLALVNGSKYTLADIKYLGFCELTLGCIGLFLPGFGLTLWALGFGVLHIIYGLIMWNKYDKNTGKA